MSKKKGANKFKQRCRTVAGTTFRKVPIVVKSTPIFSEKTDIQTLVAFTVEVFSAFHIKTALKASTNPRFHWSGDAWVAVTRTKKVYDSAFAHICEAALAEDYAVDDQRSMWLPTTAAMCVTLYEDTDRSLFARIVGETFQHRALLREHGNYDGLGKFWDCDPKAVTALLPLLAQDGVPVFGNFNAENAFTETLVKEGFKRCAAPEHVQLEEDMEFWSTTA